MKTFTVNDYLKALKNAGPKTTENLLQRAIRDNNISNTEFIKLEDYVDKKRKRYLERN